MIDCWLPVVQYIPVDQMVIEPIENIYYTVTWCERYVGIIPTKVLGRYFPW